MRPGQYCAVWIVGFSFIFAITVISVLDAISLKKDECFEKSLVSLVASGSSPQVAACALNSTDTENCFMARAENGTKDKNTTGNNKIGG